MITNSLVSVTSIRAAWSIAKVRHFATTAIQKKMTAGSQLLNARVFDCYDTICNYRPLAGVAYLCKVRT